MNKQIIAGGIAAVIGLASTAAHADIVISPPHLPNVQFVVRGPAPAQPVYAQPVYAQPAPAPVYVQPTPAPVYVRQPMPPVYTQPVFAPGSFEPRAFDADMDARMDRRMRNIEWRVQNGSLSPVALQDAREDRANIVEHIRFAARDGVIDRHESREIRAMVRSMGMPDQDVAPMNYGGGPDNGGWDRSRDNRDNDGWRRDHDGRDNGWSHRDRDGRGY